MTMKKALLTALAMTFFSFGQTYADDGALGVTDDLTNTTVSNIGECTLLSAAVKISLSANVHGAVYCGSLTAGDNTAGMIFFGTCHETGTNQDRELNCNGVDDPEVGCTAGGTYTVTGLAAYLGSSNGGVIGMNNLNNTACTDASMVTRVNLSATTCAAAAGPESC